LLSSFDQINELASEMATDDMLAVAGEFMENLGFALDEVCAPLFEVLYGEVPESICSKGVNSLTSVARPLVNTFL
jgi:hypothetical protein